MNGILLSRTDRIGDLVLSTAAIASVRKSFPEARITMVCSPYNRVVMERNTDVDEIVELDSAMRPAQVGAQFRGGDLAIALAPRWVDLAVAGATRARVRVGYTYVRRYVQRLIAHRYVNRLMLSEADPDLSERDPHRYVRHEVDQLLDLVKLAGVTERISRLRLDITDADRAAGAHVPPNAIVLHLGLRWFRKGSTLESTVALIGMLRRFDVPMVVTYAPECADAAAAIEQANVADVLAGDLPFHAWAAIFERARVVITVDTGATHVASAMRRPTLVAFEHRYFRLNSQEWAPYDVPNVIVRKPENEAPHALAQFREHIVDGVAQLLHA